MTGWNRTGWVCAAVAAVLVTLVPTTGLAQDEDDAIRWEGSVDVGFTLTEGNSRTTSLSFGANGVHERPRQRVTVNGSFLRATNDGQETANRANGTLQYDYVPGETFFVFSRLGVGFNRPAGLDRRLAPAFGAGLVVLRTERFRVALEGGASWISDRFANDSTSTSLFGSLGETLNLNVNEFTSFVQSLTYTPRAGQLSDYLLHGEATLTTQLFDPVGLKLSFIEDFDSTPFVDTTGTRRARNDLTFITGLTVTF